MQIGHWGDGRGCRSYGMFFWGVNSKISTSGPGENRVTQVQEMHATSILA